MKIEFLDLVLHRVLDRGVLIIVLVMTLIVEILLIKNIFSPVILTPLFMIFILISIWQIRRNNPISKTIAIVGFSQSGKTTLLVSLFGEIFAGNLPIRIIPRGTKTIERINESLEMLQKGRALGPTKDQDRFSFRADVTVGHLFPRTYKVEFGDFPGEESREYSEENKSWLHHTEFFKWVVDSDALIFVIDIGPYLARDELRKLYVAKITKAFRAAWQHFLDNNDYRISKVRRQPLILVFTKADLFGVGHGTYHDWDFIENEIAKLGFGENIPPIKEIDHLALELRQYQMKEDFAELIQYFEREAPNFQVLFTSSFGLFNGKRLGIKDLMMAVLPP